VSFRVPTDKRDVRKTAIATFANFIHHIDASIAMTVVEDIIFTGAPIYTVHDNFITTPSYSELIPSFYSDAIIKLGPPLVIILTFIYMNFTHPINPSMAKVESRELLLNSEKLRQFLLENIPTKGFKPRA